MISSSMQDAINAQIHREFESAYIYLAMSAWFEHNDLPGFAHWMRQQASEERAHAMRLYTYLHERGGKVVLHAITQPPDEYGTTQDAVKNVLEHERMITKSIHDLYGLAQSEADYATQSHLQWFIDEQVEEEASAEGLLARVGLVEKGHGSLLMLDRELAERTAE